MNLIEFLESDDPLPISQNLLVDGLSAPDALREAVLVDLRMNFVESAFWLLLDCRGALNVQEGNTAVVVLTGAGVGSWNLPSTGTLAWQVIIDWNVLAVDDGIELRIGLLAGGDVVIRAAGGQYIVGDVPGGDEPPPDFTVASKQEVRHGMARWASEFEIRGNTNR